LPKDQLDYELKYVAHHCSNRIAEEVNESLAAFMCPEIS
jgi:hypothetical protein